MLRLCYTMTHIATQLINYMESIMRYLIAIALALFLMSSCANAQADDGPVIITQQGVFTIIQSDTATRVCTRQGSFVVCN